jgi:hypothetical protein
LVEFRSRRRSTFKRLHFDVVSPTWYRRLKTDVVSTLFQRQVKYDKHNIWPHTKIYLLLLWYFRGSYIRKFDMKY